MPRSPTLRRCSRSCCRSRGRAVGPSLIALARTALGAFPRYLQKPMMNRVAPRGEPRPIADRAHLLGTLVIALLIAQVLMGGLGATRSWLSAWLGNRLSHDIRVQLYEHLQFLSLGFSTSGRWAGYLARQPGYRAAAGVPRLGLAGPRDERAPDRRDHDRAL